MSKSIDLLHQARLGAEAAVDAAAGVRSDLRSDPDLADVCDDDLCRWENVRDDLREGTAASIRCARSTVAMMDTACRDYLDAAPLGGPREALCAVLGVELLVKTEAQLVREFQQAVRAQFHAEG